MKKPDWTTAPTDAQFYSCGRFRKHEGGVEFCRDYGWFRDSFNDLDWHKELEDFEMRPETPAWSGEGLPPVGTVCEYFPYHHKCEIVAEHKGFLVAWDEHDLEYFRTKSPAIFRPIKSDREKWIEQAEKAIKVAPLCQDALGAIYDAGLARLP